MLTLQDHGKGQARLSSPKVSKYSNILGQKQHGYGAMPRVEQTLAILSLVVKAFTASSQAGPCLHTMVVLLVWKNNRPRSESTD